MRIIKEKNANFDARIEYNYSIIEDFVNKNPNRCMSIGKHQKGSVFSLVITGEKPTLINFYIRDVNSDNIVFDLIIFSPNILCILDDFFIIIDLDSLRCLIIIEYAKQYIHKDNTYTVLCPDCISFISEYGVKCLTHSDFNHFDNVIINDSYLDCMLFNKKTRIKYKNFSLKAFVDIKDLYSSLQE